MLEVLSGGEDQMELVDAREQLYRAGLERRWQPLSGGSDTRRALRVEAGIQAAKSGEWMATSGAGVLRRMPLSRARGTRHIWRGSVSMPQFEWVGWRKAKRLFRKKLARPAIEYIEEAVAP